MNEQDVLNVLQYKRHELMNQLQLVQGYIHLDNKDAALEKISTIVHKENQERNLIHLDAPLFIWWLIILPIRYSMLRVDYDIHCTSKLEKNDRELYKHGKQIVETMLTYTDSQDVYHVEIQLKETQNSNVQVCIAFKGHFSHLNAREFIENEKTYWLNEAKDKMMAKYRLSIDEKV